MQIIFSGDFMAIWDELLMQDTLGVVKIEAHYQDMQYLETMFLEAKCVPLWWFLQEILLIRESATMFLLIMFENLDIGETLC